MIHKLFAATLLLFVHGLLVAQQKPYLFDNVKVLSIGIDRYDDARIPELNKAVSDAKRVANVFEKQFGYQAQLLLDRDATKNGIESALKKCNRELGGNDALIVYLACHGQYFEYAESKTSTLSTAGFVVPYDAEISMKSKDFSRWKSEAIDMQELVDTLVDFKCRHVVLIADTCCSGFLTKRGGIESAGFTTLLVEGSRSVVAATKKSESATDGLFTEYLIKRLNRYSDDGEAFSLTDLFVKIRPVVTVKSNNQMTPMLSKFGKMDGEFVFFPKSIPPKQIQMLERAIERSEFSEANIEAIRGVRDRCKKRLGSKMKIDDLHEAFSSMNYRFSTTPETGEAYWKSKVEKYREHASLGDPIAMATLHYCYSKGLGVKQDNEKAYEWAKLTNDTGHVAGKHVIGRCYLNGIGVTKNEIAGHRFIKMASDKEFSISLLTEGISLFTQKKYQAAKQKFEKAAAKNVPRAYSCLADYYRPNIVPGFEANQEKYREVLSKGESLGDSMSLKYLSAAYLQGYNGFEKDPAKAKEYLMQSASGGDSWSQAELAHEFFYGPKSIGGFSFAKNDEESMKWANLAAAGGNAKAFFVKYLLYSTSHSFLNEAKAIENLNLAAEKNHLVAVEMLARCYMEGKLVRQDHSKARQLYGRAGEMGSYSASFIAAHLYLQPVLQAQRNTVKRDVLERQNIPEAIKLLVQSIEQNKARTKLDRENLQRTSKVLRTELNSISRVAKTATDQRYPKLLEKARKLIESK